MLRSIKTFIIICGIIIFVCNDAFSWGFFAHKRINFHAIFSLPEEMLIFYKYHMDYIVENSVTPDKRRYNVRGEASKHYIDIEYYGNHPFDVLSSLNWRQAINKYTKDILDEHGTLPWTIEREKQKLILAFKEKDVAKILKISAEIGHYIADANVPLHTTENYDGQNTSQRGIHAFWESRIPELFYEEYDLFVGQAEYIKDTYTTILECIKVAHEQVKELLIEDKNLTSNFPNILKYSFEIKNKNTRKVFSEDYCRQYCKRIDNKVEKQMRKSIKMVSSFWLTCWIEAGKPDLNKLLKQRLNKQETLLENTLKDGTESKEENLLNVREHE